jgi:DNA-binding MarR family transcriptional regulator
MTRFIDFEQLSRYRSADDSPGLQLWRTQQLWRRTIEAALAPHELTHTQFVLLAAVGYLAKDGAAVAQTDLAKFTSCDVTMTSQVVRGLEAKGLMVRIQKKDDARAKYPQLTPAGLAKLKKAMRDVEAADEAFFAQLGSKSGQFLKCLKLLLAE